MTGTEAFLIAALVLTWVGLFVVMVLSAKEGYRDGYSNGYSDRDEETMFGEPPGTRDRRHV